LTFLNSIILGIIQGLTEFLPVSSSGHLVIAEHLLPGWQPAGGIVFEITLHLATLLAVIIFFRRDLALLIASLWRRGPEESQRRYFILMLILATIPTGIIGLLGKKFFVSLFERLDIVGAMLLLTALLLWRAESRAVDENPQKDITPGRALVIGIAQGIAIIPGISRSGATIATAMLGGIDAEQAARFSFLLSIPAISGAALLSLKDFQALPPGQLPPALAGAAAALVTGLLALKLLLLILKQRRLRLFAVYCAIVGALTLLGALFCS
jgi:undecaprenyl-diphosphatase